MIRTLLKAVAYSRAPRTTFTVLHPAKAVLFRKFQWDMRHAYAPRITALGAAALALPVGLWLGRRTANSNGAAESEWRGVWRGDSADSGPRAAHGAERTTTDTEDTISADATGSLGIHRTRGGCIDQTAIGL